MKAFCKINLFLHITGKRDDGYHSLESLFYFPNIYDEIEITEGEESLFIMGKFAHKLQGDAENNIIFKAYKLLQQKFPEKVPELSFLLVKNLPVASGIGGGSANAALVLRELNKRYHLGLSTIDLFKLGVKLGADVPVCILSEPCFAQGIGEVITPVPNFPKIHLVLANPNVEVSTAEIFKMGFSEFSAPVKNNFEFSRTQSLIDFLDGTHNDLEKNALQLCPSIHDVLADIGSQEGNLLARMSGSGATCFGIFETKDKALQAKQNIISKNPNWWVEAC